MVQFVFGTEVFLISKTKKKNFIDSINVWDKIQSIKMDGAIRNGELIDER